MEKKLLYLVAAALVAMLVLTPFALAQGEEVEEVAGGEEVIETPVEEAAEEPIEEAAGIDVAETPAEEAVEEAAQEAVQQEQPVGEATVETEAVTPQGEAMQKAEATVIVPEGTAPLPASGGPGIGGSAAVLPAAAALLLGSGVLAYAVLHRR